MSVIRRLGKFNKIYFAYYSQGNLGNSGRFGRQTSAEDWKRGFSPGHTAQHPSWDNVFNSPQSRLNSASSLSSPRSGSSSSEDVNEGIGQDRGHFGAVPRDRGQFGAGQPDRQQFGRRQGPRPNLTERASDSDGRQMQQYGWGCDQSINQLIN